jgi:hypothetical protein
MHVLKGLTVYRLVHGPRPGPRLRRDRLSRLLLVLPRAVLLGCLRRAFWLRRVGLGRWRLVCFAEQLVIVR